mmetsp:Transcript_43051/g.77393  ORF Transcript_43051/g.77393 Transcript_43051/m.77393 type:complete len:210 (-) Transcript_43051:557-1186(-)
MGSVDYLDRIRRLGGVLIMIHFTYIIIILSIAIGISYSPNHCRDGVCRVDFSVFDHHQHWCSHYLYGEGEHSFRSSSIFTSRCCPHRKRVCGSTSQRVAMLIYCAIHGRRSKCDSFVNPIRHLILASHCHPRHQLFPLLLAAGLHLNRAEQAGYNGEQLTRQWNLGNKKRQFGNSTRCVASCSAPIVNNLNSGERSKLASFLNDSTCLG